jgi:hypothetical protein
MPNVPAAPCRHAAAAGDQFFDPKQERLGGVLRRTAGDAVGEDVVLMAGIPWNTVFLRICSKKNS